MNSELILSRMLEIVINRNYIKRNESCFNHFI